MAHFHVKRKNGRPYLYVREIARVGGKPTVISQVYIGSPERVRELASEGGLEEKQLKVEEFGALWLALQADSGIDLAGIIDAVVPRVARETGPSVGEYFLYAILNRMVEARSKRALPEWYAATAIQQIRPVATSELTSERYWDKWDRVSEKDLREIARRFFARVWELESPPGDCLLWDTTNYYTYMASQTKSELARRGRNKDGKHNLRQVGMALLAGRGSRLPLFYREYPGNVHDSKQFGELMDEMFGVVSGFAGTKERLTVVMDKGMNSEGNFRWIDEHSRVHFVTTYSTYFAEELAQIPLNRFEPVESNQNRQLAEDGQSQERILAYRTTGEYWGKERVAVVTYHPATARKQEHVFLGKLEEIREELLEMRTKVRDGAPHWNKPDAIQERYLRLCERLHISSEFYTLEFAGSRKTLSMGFRKNQYRVDRKLQSLGKNIHITDNTDWTTAEIVGASLGRWEIEDRFRQSKDDAHVGALPIRHWTDSKIRCHLFCCVAAMTYLRMIELRLEKAGVKRTANDVMDEMRRLHSVLTLTKGARSPRRQLETPTKTQAKVLSAFGHQVDKSGVLQTRD